MLKFNKCDCSNKMARYIRSISAYKCIVQNTFSGGNTARHPVFSFCIHVICVQHVINKRVYAEFNTYSPKMGMCARFCGIVWSIYFRGSSCLAVYFEASKKMLSGWFSVPVAGAFLTQTFFSEKKFYFSFEKHFPQALFFGKMPALE